MLTPVPHFLTPHYSLENYVCKIIVCQLFFTPWQPQSGLPYLEWSHCPSSHGMPHFRYLILLSALSSLWDSSLLSSKRMFLWGSSLETQCF